MTQILNFILKKQPPTWPEFEEICPDGGVIPDCDIRVDPDYWGIPEPIETYGDLEVIHCPMESLTAKCGASVSVWMRPGCPPETSDVVCDTVQNPIEIAQDSSETIYILDGYPPYKWEIVGGSGFSLRWETTDDLGGRPDERLNSQNILYSSSASCGKARVKITDNCSTEVICEFDSSLASELNWDAISSGKTIVTGESGVTIAVRDGIGPYTWSVVGLGFSLGSAVTVGRFNTLNANWCACGTADITVTDGCDSQANGSVRCSDCGEWVLHDSCIQGYDFAYTWPDFYTADGKYKIEYSDHCTTEYPIDWTCCTFSEPYGYTFPLEQCNWCWDRSRGQHSKTEVFIWVPGSDHEVEYDWTNSAQTVLKSSSATVYVIGGTPPYTWDISGVGFSLQHTETTGLSNTVITSAAACGSGVITVEDKCDFQVGGSIRCSNGGQWVQIEHTDNGDEACGIMRGVGVDYHNTWSLICDAGGCYESWRGKYHVYEIAETNLNFWYGYPYTCADCNCDYWVPNGCVTCLQNTVLDCSYADPGTTGTFPCCYSDPKYHCKAVYKRLLEEWKCP